MQKTPGGVLSSVTHISNLNECYDLLFEEVMTNIVKMFRGKIIHIGSESVYMLVNRVTKIEPEERNLYDIKLNFIPEEVQEVLRL